jgi:hypothetical protein
MSKGQLPERISTKGDIGRPVRNHLSIENVLRALSADKSLVLFNTIALSSFDSDILISRLGFTRKQYYSRLSALVGAGLIKRRNRKYFLSSFGKIVYDAQLIIGQALQNYWRLVAIDSVELPDIERKKIIQVLIENPEIRVSLLGGAHCEVMNDKIVGINNNDDHSVRGAPKICS